MLPDGLSAFPITPANDAGRVDTHALRRLVSRLCDASVDSVGILGSTGTYAYLPRSERRRALDAALEEADGRVPVLVGIGALRTDEAVALAQDAKAAGATCGLLAAVSYTPLTQEEVFQHFRTVASEGGLPICIYDNPSTTRFAFTPDLVARLAALEGIMAVKSPTTSAQATRDHLATLRAKVPESFSLGYSGDWNATEAMIAGADTWYSVLAGLFPAPCMEIVRAVRRSDEAKARELDKRLDPLWALFREHSSLRVVHACAHALGLSRTDPPRPILPLDAATQQRVLKVVERLNLR